MKTKRQYAAHKLKMANTIGSKMRLRNPSKNTIKKIMRRAWLCVDWQERQWHTNDMRNYFLFNWVGARLYIMSQGRICNREPKGYQKIKLKP
jgi:hypothetical protein